MGAQAKKKVVVQPRIQNMGCKGSKHTAQEPGVGISPGLNQTLLTNSPTKPSGDKDGVEECQDSAAADKIQKNTVSREEKTTHLGDSPGEESAGVDDPEPEAECAA